MLCKLFILNTIMTFASIIGTTELILKCLQFLVQVNQLHVNSL